MKFELLLLRKDYMGESTIAMFEFKAEKCLGHRGERITFKDSSHKVEAFLVC